MSGTEYTDEEKRRNIQILGNVIALINNGCIQSLVNTNKTRFHTETSGNDDANKAKTDVCESLKRIFTHRLRQSLHGASSIIKEAKKQSIDPTPLMLKAMADQLSSILHTIQEKYDMKYIRPPKIESLKTGSENFIKDINDLIGYKNRMAPNKTVSPLNPVDDIDFYSRDFISDLSTIATAFNTLTYDTGHVGFENMVKTLFNMPGRNPDYFVKDYVRDIFTYDAYKCIHSPDEIAGIVVNSEYCSSSIIAKGDGPKECNGQMVFTKGFAGHDGANKSTKSKPPTR